MEAQNALLRGYLYQPGSSILTRKTPSFTRFSISGIGSRRWVSMRSNFSFSADPSLTKRNSRCRNSVEENGYKGFPDIEDNKPKANIRKKNLAVFVSGGGSNFRSIYEATLNGSVHGDVVVLVTNKHGMRFNLHSSFVSCFVLIHFLISESSQLYCN